MLIVVFKEAYTKAWHCISKYVQGQSNFGFKNNNPIAGDKVISEFLSKDISSVRRTERICNEKQHNVPFIAMRPFSHHILVEFFGSNRSSKLSAVKYVEHHFFVQPLKCKHFDICRSPCLENGGLF